MTTETVKGAALGSAEDPNPLSDKKVRELSGALNLFSPKSYTSKARSRSR